MSRLYWYVLFFMLCSLPAAHAQLTINGITRDSVTLEPLPFVSISVAGKARAMSNIDGQFTFTCHIGDSSAYTHMGYRKKFKVHFKNEISLTILLGESAHLLKSITVIDNYKPQGSENWKDAVQYYKSPFINPVGTDPNAVQTFGVGARINGPISFFSKDAKDKRKYEKVMEEQNATTTYREVLASDEVKQDLMNMYSFTEAEYYKKIEKFNIQYPQAAYIKDRKEVINRLIQFFAIKEK